MTALATANANSFKGNVDVSVPVEAIMTTPDKDDGEKEGAEETMPANKLLLVECSCIM